MSKQQLIQQYLSWILKQYQAVQQNIQDAYRIIDIEIKDNIHWLTIQIVGKSITFKCKPEEIAADDLLLEKFSKKDVRTIIYYACHEIKQPKRKIIWQKFSEKFNQMIFGVRMRQSGEIIENNSLEISNNPEMLKQFDSLDAHKIGYSTATQLILKEKELKEQAH